MRPRPLIAVWLCLLVAVVFFVVGFVGYYGRGFDRSVVDIASGAFLLVVAALVYLIFCRP